MFMHNKPVVVVVGNNNRVGSEIVVVVVVVVAVAAASELEVAVEQWWISSCTIREVQTPNGLSKKLKNNNNS